MNPGTRGDPEELSVAETLSQLKQQQQLYTGAGIAAYVPQAIQPLTPTTSNTVSVKPEGVDGVHPSSKEQTPIEWYYRSETVETKSVLDKSSISTESIEYTNSSHNSPRDSPLPVAPRYPSRSPKAWRKVLITATSLVLTKDAKKKLRHLLALLRLASEHLNAKVSILKAAMEKDASDDNVTPGLSQMAIRNDIITTIKKSLTMLSTLATNSLPRTARNRLRHMILKLPSRWAMQLDAGASVDGQCESAVLALATETLLSIRNITSILSETLERADSWVEKLPDKQKQANNDISAQEYAEVSNYLEGKEVLSQSDNTEPDLLNEKSNIPGETLTHTTSKQLETTAENGDHTTGLNPDTNSSKDVKLSQEKCNHNVPDPEPALKPKPDSEPQET